MPSIREVAAYAEVGIGTVSRALNGTGYVSRETKEKIEDAVKALNYHPNELSRNSCRNKSGMIGVVVPDLENPFFAKFLKYTEIELYKQGYKAVVCNTVEISRRVEELIELMKQNVLDGLIVGVDPPENVNLKMLKKPVVSLDRNWGEQVPVVTSDNEKGGRLVAEQIVEAGCRSVLMFEGRAYLKQPFDSRVREVKRILTENHVSIMTANIEWNLLSYEYYMQAVEKYLSIFDRVDAVYAADMIAAACLAVAHKRGIRVPEELKIMGFDGLDIARLTSPVLTTVKQDVPQMAKCCVETLIKLLEGEKNIPPMQVCDVALFKGGTI